MVIFKCVVLGALMASIGCVAEDGDTSEAEQGLVVGGCRLYKEANFGGASMFILTGRDYNDLHRINGFGDVVSSIDCQPGVLLRIHVDSNFGGVSHTVNAVRDLATLGMDNKLSSVSWPLDQTGICTFWIDANFQGAGYRIQAGRDHNDMHRAQRAFGDNISSVECSAGTPPVTVCTNDTWGGSCTTLSGSVADLAPLGFGDNISSVGWF